MTRPTGIRAWLSVYLKGACMGAADTVPGVSGGTIALVLGVYERFIAALTAIDVDTLWELRAIHTADGRARAAAALVRADVPFLLVLGAGALSSAATIATGMNVAVTQFPAPTYSFFFGLIAASAIVLFRYVTVGTPQRLFVGVLGFAIAFVVTDPSLSGARTTTLPVLFIAGTIAISAMVLPGISGAFLLLIMGQYEFVSAIPRTFFDGFLALFDGNTGPLLDALAPLVVFMLGALVGLFSVAYAVRAALDRFREGTLVFLISLMIGALRLPVTEVSENVEALSPATVALVAVPIIAGAAVVLLLDHYTDDLEY